MQLDDRSQLPHGALEFLPIDRSIEHSLKRALRLRLAGSALAQQILVVQSPGDGWVEELLLDGNMSYQVAGQLRQERLSGPCAAALNGLAELLQIAVLTFEQGCGFHGLRWWAVKLCASHALLVPRRGHDGAAFIAKLPRKFDWLRTRSAWPTATVSAGAPKGRALKHSPQILLLSCRPWRPGGHLFSSSASTVVTSPWLNWLPERSRSEAEAE